MKKIAFLAEKGGAGKTTQAFNFASYLAHQGKQVLLVDLDHQASLSGDIFWDSCFRRHKRQHVPSTTRYHPSRCPK